MEQEKVESVQFDKTNLHNAITESFNTAIENREKEVSNDNAQIFMRLDEISGKIDALLMRQERQQTLPQAQTPMQPPPERTPQQKQMFQAVCSLCGANTEVPFKPWPNQTIKCRECWSRIKAQNGGY